MYGSVVSWVRDRRFNVKLLSTSVFLLREPDVLNHAWLWLFRSVRCTGLALMCSTCGVLFHFIYFLNDSTEETSHGLHCL